MLLLRRQDPRELHAADLVEHRRLVRPVLPEMLPGMVGDDRVTEVDKDAGIALTEKLMEVIEPLVDGLPSDLVIEAMAGAMVATLAGGVTNTRDARLVLHRYANRILDFAEMIE